MYQEKKTTVEEMNFQSEELETEASLAICTLNKTFSDSTECILFSTMDQFYHFRLIFNRSISVCAHRTTYGLLR